jgi:subtilisin family serine protease
MKADYIVLRDSNQTLRRSVIGIARPLGVSSAEFGEIVRSKPQVAPAPTIETIQDAEPAQVAELARDEDALAVARAMRITQIEPTSNADSGSADDGPGPTWGIAALGADTCNFKGQSAKVAVIDSGIRKTHLAFPKNEITIMDQDFTGLDSTVDQSGHGTHCAATILGRDVKGRRIGVAPGVKTLLAARIFGPGVITTSQMVVKALQWAMNNGANVISMSLDFDFTGLAADLAADGLPVAAATAQALVEFQNNLRLFDGLMSMFRAQEAFPDAQGCVIIGAAGNFSKRPIYSVSVAAPCNAIGLVSVGAVQRGQFGMDIARFSNSNPTLVAPGVAILSADFSGDDLLVLKDGTSMACPHVAGLAALWWDSVNLGGAPHKAATVVNNLQASCRLDPLNPGLDVADRGNGIPCAPNV